MPPVAASPVRAGVVRTEALLCTAHSNAGRRSRCGEARCAGVCAGRTASARWMPSQCRSPQVRSVNASPLCRGLQNLSTVAVVQHAGPILLHEREQPLAFLEVYRW